MEPRGVGGPGPVAERLVDPRRPALGLVRTVRGEVRPHARHDERHEQRTAAGLLARSRSASSHTTDRGLGSPATSAVSASPHIGGRTSSTSSARPADLERRLEQGAGALDVAAPERHEAEGVARAEGARAGCRARRARSRPPRSPRPSDPRPRRRARTRRPSRGGSRTARSRPRSAGPSRSPICGDAVVHHVRRDRGRGPVGGHAGALEARVARDPRDLEHRRRGRRRRDPAGPRPRSR